VNDSSPTFVDCRIENNQSRFASGGMAVTGHFDTSRSLVTLRDVTLANNLTVRSSVDTEAQGGGMHIEDNVDAVVERVPAAGNVASGRGGGVVVDRTIATIVRTAFLSNQATATSGSWGGALSAVGSSTTTIDQSTIAGNSAGVIGGGVFADQGGQLQVLRSAL